MQNNMLFTALKEFMQYIGKAQYTYIKMIKDDNGENNMLQYSKKER